MGANDKKAATFHPLQQMADEINAAGDLTREQHKPIMNEPPLEPLMRSDSKATKAEVDSFVARAESQTKKTPNKSVGRIGKPEFRTLDKLIVDQGISNVIDKLTAPPESLRQHAERLGYEFEVTTIMNGDRVHLELFEIRGNYTELLQREAGNQGG